MFYVDKILLYFSYSSKQQNKETHMWSYMKSCVALWFNETNNRITMHTSRDIVYNKTKPKQVVIDMYEWRTSK